MSTKYSLTVDHQGTELGDFCIYQTLDEQIENIHSLVWFKKAAHPGTTLKFDWTVDYSFAWDEMGELIPGVVFDASQIKAADPSDISNNSIGFTKFGGAYKFTQTDDKTSRGSLGIHCDDTIQPNSASIGIGMSGKAAFACVASPNLHYTFSPHPRYWIAFGRFQPGEVIDLNVMTRKFEIRFNVNEFDKKVMLTGNNTWKLA
jgi:hypothetical protein